MIRFKDISIPKPCSIDYDALPGNEIKRFCGSCEKHVYDFRGKDEGYLNEVFQKTGKVCGVYYEDQILSSQLKIQRSFYHTFFFKLISIVLFIKSILSMQDAQASTIYIPKIEQELIDSSGVKVVYKEKKTNIDIYVIDIYINDSMYTYELTSGESFLYLPDHLKADDNIKVVVRKTKYKFRYSIVKVKPRTYSFKYKKSETITIHINSKRKIKLLKKRRRQIQGRINRF